MEDTNRTHYNLAREAMAEGMVGLAQIGRVAQSNFVIVTKAQDYDYLEGKRVADIVESAGMRELGSRHNPGGPTQADPGPATG